MQDLRDILLALLTASPFLMDSLLCALLNQKRERRAYQFYMPLLALLYCLLASLFAQRLLGLLNILFGWLRLLLGMLPYIGGSLSQWGSTVLGGLQYGGRAAVWQNLLFLSAFFVIKALCRPLARSAQRARKDSWLAAHTAWVFYRKRRTFPLLRQKYGDMRKLTKAIYIAALILGWVNCAMLAYSEQNYFFAFPFYPAFGVILLGEIFFFLNGRTADEKGLSDEDEPEDEDETECSEILSALKACFGDRLGYADQQPAALSHTPEEDWYAALSEGDALDQVTASYYYSLGEAGQEIEPDYVIAANKLIHGESLLICNPFYRDMTDYITLPVLHTLLNRRSCLIVCGRNTNERDVQAWIGGCLTCAASLHKLWSVELLNGVPREGEPADIGILSFERIYDMRSLKENQAFFRNVSLVILLEPSNLLGTGQIGLRSVLQFCETERGNPHYCILDRNADGLVDALSHAVRQSITEVIASPSASSGHCRAFWRAEGPGLQTRLFPNISHYMGVGGELSVLAARVGSGAMHWYSGNKMPLTDLKWNFEQYYAAVCRYLDKAEDQIELSKQFHFHESLWQASFGPRSFVLAEDEFCNAFEMERAFGARVREKGFINILSENYLLRDYMYANHALFTSDPKALPSFVPDYARTERNFVLRTLMLMAIRPVEESVLSKELSLHGIETSHVYGTFKKLVIRHTDLKEPKILTRPSEHGKMDIVGCTRYAFSVDPTEVDRVFDSALRNAYFIIENEQTGTYLMGNRLMDHVEQVMLPGQFFSYDGRYYQVRSISREHGIVVRRAADHLSGRLYYRQLREYRLRSAAEGASEQAPYGQDATIEVKNLRGIRIERLFCEVSVHTRAYLEMSSRCDMPGASYVELDSRAVKDRRLRHKEILRLEIPDAAPELRYALCLLLNELFQTVYPNECGYLTAVMADIPEKVRQEADYAEKLAALVPAATVEDGKNNAVYIIEDSNIDLGLLISFERNLQRYLEMLADYLTWYLDPSRSIDEENGPPSDGGDEAGDGEDGSGNSGDEDPEEGEPAGKRGLKNLLSRLKSWLARLFRRRRRKPLAEEAAPPLAYGRPAPDRTGDDVDGEDEEVRSGGSCRRSERKARYEYLTFGYSVEREPDWLALSETLRFLAGKGFLDSNLHRAHENASSFDDGSDYDPTQPGTHYCDFCGRAMQQGEYTVLKDGRERCGECGRDAVRTKKQFKQVYRETVSEMEKIFNIRFDRPIIARMSNARKVNEGLRVYKPSPRFDTRVLGYAQGSLVMVENGAPLWKMKQTLVHELTHIWQNEHWDSNYRGKYNRDESVTAVTEGMAVWAEIQYLLSMGQREMAVMYKRNRDYDSSAYGAGMKLFLDRYPPRETDAVDLSRSPFGRFPPV